MKLTMLRKERDELIETLRDSECDEFDAPEDELLEDCCKGIRLDKFEREFTTKLDGKLIWDSHSHERFHQVCKEIADLEYRLYEAAFAEVEQRCQP